MKIKSNIDFYLVQRIGRKGGTQLRPTVPKYVQHKDRETVRHAILGSEVVKWHKRTIHLQNGRSRLTFSTLSTVQGCKKTGETRFFCFKFLIDKQLMIR